MSEPGTWAAGCSSIPTGYTVPDGYDVNNTGVYLVKVGRDGEQQRTRVTYAPLVPVSVLVDPAGNQMVELVWRDDQGRWVRRSVPRSVTKNGRRLIAALGDAGLPAVDGDAKQVERWIAACQAANRDHIPRHDLARWLGWQPDGSFVASPGGNYRVEPTYDEQAGAVAAHQAYGTLAAWRDAVKAIAAYPVAQMALYAALAAPLLDPLGVDSFTVDLAGRSTRGKTTAAKIGLSAWADPAEKADGMFSWRSTLLAIEKRLNIVRGLPVVLDETRVVKAPEIVDQVLYQVPKNHGQARSGPWPSMLPWSTVVISTGEQSALSFTTHAGASARVLALTRPPFGGGGTDNARAAVDVARAIEDNHGVAGPAFAQRLVELLAETTGGADPVTGRDRLRARHRVLTEAVRGTTDMSGRRAPMVAALVLAAELAHEWGVAPFRPPAPAVWLDLFAAADPTDNRPEMALDVIREYVASHGQDLWQPGRRAAPAGGWIGRHYALGGVKTIALLPLRVKGELERAGYAVDAVIAGWRDAKYLHEAGTDRTPYLLSRELGLSKSRMYIFTPGTIESAEDDGE